MAIESNVDPDLATKSALLHDMGHYEWYRDGKWDYEEYRKHDIHAIKGAERAHKLLIRLGRPTGGKRGIACCTSPHRQLSSLFLEAQRTELQEVVRVADEKMSSHPGCITINKWTRVKRFNYYTIWI